MIPYTDQCHTKNAGTSRSMPHKEPHQTPIEPLHHKGKKTHHTEIEVTLKCHLMKEQSQGIEEINIPSHYLTL